MDQTEIRAGIGVLCRRRPGVGELVLGANAVTVLIPEISRLPQDDRRDGDVG